MIEKHVKKYIEYDNNGDKTPHENCYNLLVHDANNVGHYFDMEYDDTSIREKNLRIEMSLRANSRTVVTDVRDFIEQLECLINILKKDFKI
jgi:hypothetical protein